MAATHLYSFSVKYSFSGLPPEKSR